MKAIDDLHKRAIECAKKYQQAELALIEVLQEVNRRKAYEALGYASLFTYAVEALGLPPERVYQFNGVAKKCEQVPQLKEAIRQGRLNVSRARRIVSVLSPENSQMWIEKAATLSQRELEREVAAVSPRPAVPERMKPLSERLVAVSFTTTAEVEKKLQRLKDIYSQKTGKNCSLAEVIAFMSEEMLERLDPVRKAERNVKKSSPRPVLSSRIIPARVQHEVRVRDKGQCTFVHPNGRRCEARRWLHLHHIRPKSQGGKHTPDNLTTLCSHHHRITHGTRPALQAVIPGPAGRPQR